MLFLQLHGYFVKYSAEEGRPPLIFVLSEQSVKVVLFPFVNKSDEPLVESILLADYPLWERASLQDGSGGSMDVLNRRLLVLLLLLCSVHKSHTQAVQIVYPENGTPKRDLYWPYTETESMIEHSEQTVSSFHLR